jgi:2-methylfumaryl-CoA isomerase
MQTMHHPKVGDFKMPTWPVRFDGKPPVVKPSPLLGADTAAVLSEWLGKSTCEIARLKASKVAGA